MIYESWLAVDKLIAVMKHLLLATLYLLESEYMDPYR